MNWAVLFALIVFAMVFLFIRPILTRGRASILAVVGAVGLMFCTMVTLSSIAACAVFPDTGSTAAEGADPAELIIPNSSPKLPENTVLKDEPADMLGTLEVHFIDVGQGESEFIELPDGKTLLIDAGSATTGSTVVNYIASLGYTKLDYLVITHSHEPHMGGAPLICKAFNVGEIWAPEILVNSNVYADFFNNARDKGTVINVAAKGKILPSRGCTIEILSPDYSLSSDDPDDCSVVLEVTHGDNTFLFTSDAPAAVLKEVCDDSVDVLKVGSHGDDASTDAVLVSQLTPSYAVISCGKFNSGGYPEAGVLSVLSATSVLRTDLQKTITATSDEEGLSFDKISITSSNAPFTASTTVTLILAK